MGLCPDNRITGGRIHAAPTRKVQNRLAKALRIAAVTVAAHKLTRLLWAMVKHRRPCDPERPGTPELARAGKERSLRRQTEPLGFAWTPVLGEAS